MGKYASFHRGRNQSNEQLATGFSCLVGSHVIFLWEKRPYSPKLTANSFEFHWINPVTGSDFVKLVVFTRIDHLTY